MLRKGFLSTVSFLLIVFGAAVLFSAFVSTEKNTDSANASRTKEKVFGQTNFQEIKEGINQPEYAKKDITQEDLVLVTKVIDGDTIEIEGGERVRYIGIDTPETVDPRKTVQCFGREATDKNKSLVSGKKVYLEKDISDTDKYGRLLRYIWIPSESSRQAVLVNEVLVEEGFAYSSVYPPDIKYQDRLDEAQTIAQNKKSGLWGSCNVAGIQKSKVQSSIQPQSGDCQIKGNISSVGEKIYHLPSQRYYNKTAISESKGERWFCSEKEAIEAGWRKSKI